MSQTVLRNFSTHMIKGEDRNLSNSQQYFRAVFFISGTAVGQWLRCCATNQKAAGSIPAGVNGYFIDIKSFLSHYGPEVDSASNRNEYQEYFLGVKSGRSVRLTTLPPSCAVVAKSGSLNFVEPSGPVTGLLYRIFWCVGTNVSEKLLPTYSEHILLCNLESNLICRSCSYSPQSSVNVNAEGA